MKKKGKLKTIGLKILEKSKVNKNRHNAAITGNFRFEKNTLESKTAKEVNKYVDDGTLPPQHRKQEPYTERALNLASISVSFTEKCPTEIKELILKNLNDAIKKSAKQSASKVGLQ